ncbi:hypothetical protein [Agrobacterium tumefaciens]|uniref:hypothetical protein n=1 Tax=Agrobacterium tumefaciens TaxID=358 RepID=UPI001F2D9A84
MASVWDWLSDRADRTFNGTISADERRKREREEAEAAERQRLIEAQRLADLEAQQAGYIDDAYAADQYRKQQDQARTNTASAIEIGRQNVAAGPSSAQYQTNQPARYVADKKARLTSDPFLVVEDEQVDPTPSPMAYVLTGETYSDPSQTPSVKPESKSNAFWDFLGLQDQEDRKRWSNGMLRAGGAILGAGTPDWAEALGKGVGAYAKAGDDYDKAAQDRTLIDQKRRANEIALAEGEKSKSVQALTCHCEFPPEWIRVRPIKGRTHEEAAIYGRADYCGVEGAGGWREGGRPLPQAWNFRSNVLQLESQIRRHGGL